MRKLALAVAVALLLSLAVMLIPRPAAAQEFGPKVDELIFSIVDQPQAVAALDAGDIDVYVFGLEEAADKQAAIDNPGVSTRAAPTSINDMLFNPVPHGAGVPGFNPFTIREVREAMNWALDRDFIINEIFGGFGVPYTAHYFRNVPDYARDPAFFFALEAEYSFDLERARAQISRSLSAAPGVTFDTGTGKWMFEGAPININLVQRTEDLRFEIGSYVKGQLENLGFTVTLDPSTGLESFFKVYVGDPEAGVWHVYTEGWLFGALSQFDDGQCNFFYNGDFGSAWWDFYTPPKTLSSLSVPLERSQYANLGERLDWMRQCSIEGIQDGVRVFLLAPVDVYANTVGVEGITFDLLSGNNNAISLKTLSQVGLAGGSLKVAQPIHTISGWNPWEGFTWIYESYQQNLFQDPGTFLHPHLGTGQPYRMSFETVTAGPVEPASQLPVPATAVLFDTTTMTWEPVGPGVTTKSYATFTMNWGSWHHGMPITMADMQASIAFFFRYMEGDLAPFGATPPTRSANVFYLNLLKGIEFIDANTMRIYFDFWNPDESVIAPFASWWPDVPWEVSELAAASILAGETVIHERDAGTTGLDQLDLVKGPSLGFLQPRLTTLTTANAKPPGIVVSDADAAARWAALEQWWLAHGHFYVANGAFFIDQVTTVPEGTVLKAFRTGYPISTDQWDFLSTIRKPDIAIAPAPEVIQSFPAAFDFSTSVAGQPYDLIDSATWLVVDPATRKVLVEGAGIRVAPGQFEAQLSAADTSGLPEGAYNLQMIVVGQEVASPSFDDISFASIGLQTAILTELTQTLETELAGFQGTLDANTKAVNDAVAASNSATQLTQIVLVLAVVAIVVAVVAIVLLLRRGPT